MPAAPTAATKLITLDTAVRAAAQRRQQLHTPTVAPQAKNDTHDPQHKRPNPQTVQPGGVLFLPSPTSAATNQRLQLHEVHTPKSRRAISLEQDEAGKKDAKEQGHPPNSMLTPTPCRAKMQSRLSSRNKVDTSEDHKHNSTRDSIASTTSTQKEKRLSTQIHQNNKQQDPPRMNDYSDVLTGLTGSQGSISLVTALLAGFAFAGLSSVSREDYETGPAWASYSFPVVTGISIALSLYTSVCCAILEQQGRIAKALAVARGENTVARVKYEQQLEKWYGEDSFRTWRTQLVWVFMYGSPSFAVSIGLMCVIKMPLVQGLICFAVFAVLGVSIISTLLWLNRPFRVKVLCLAATTHAAPRVSNMSDEVVRLEMKERRESELSVGNLHAVDVEDGEFFGGNDASSRD
ncbi:unnamed protein product [Amoebophrya sp. A120]|nr:unnamed protein product [Amoebophrya sp. A120]|eukprot:GSA120T00009640001.1